MSKTIFLDMDGVAAQFHEQALKLHGWEPEQLLADWQRGEWWMWDVLQITADAFWQPINDAGVDWWEDLPECPWFRCLYAALSTLAPVVFLSSPGRSSDACAGKLRWLQARYGAEFRDFIFTPVKYHCARADAVLVDDHQRQCKEFAAAGGRSIAFPRPWNGGLEYYVPGEKRQTKLRIGDDVVESVVAAVGLWGME